MTTYLLEANVLIALTVRDHEHHDRASDWIATVERFAICPIVEGALLRFLLRVGETAATAAGILTGVRDSPRCEFWPDSMSYAELDLTRLRGHRQVTDSYLAGLARSRGQRLVTFDAALAGEHPDVCLCLHP